MSFETRPRGSRCQIAVKSGWWTWDWLETRPAVILNLPFTDADRAWKRAIRHYIRNEDEMLPPIGRFNYGQKLFFWLMFYGVIVLLVSGFALWFVESIPWSLRWLRYLAIFLHVTAGLATIGAFVIHVYMGTAMVRGGFTSIVRGEVSAAWARTHVRREMFTRRSPRSPSRVHAPFTRDGTRPAPSRP